MVELKVDKGIPIPPKIRSGLYMPTFRKMKVGDSVFLKSKKEVGSVYGTVHKYGFKVAIRKVNNGYRMWVLELPKQI